MIPTHVEYLPEPEVPTQTANETTPANETTLKTGTTGQEMMQMSPVTSPGQLSTDETMEENEEAREKANLVVPPLCSMRTHFLNQMGGIIGGETLDPNVPSVKEFSDAFDNWNWGVKNPDSHISLDCQKHILYLWAQEEYELVQSPEVKTTFYSTWFSLYQGLPYGELIAKSCMLLPQARLMKYLQIDPDWTQPQQFIHVPAPPHGSSNEVSYNKRRIYHHKWDAYVEIGTAKRQTCRPNLVGSKTDP